MEKLSGNLPVQGGRHLILDMIITEATKMRPYLNFIKDKETIINIARQNYAVMKETLDKRLVETPQNNISFLNTLLEEELKTMGIKDKITVINWEKKCIRKHHHVEYVQAKENKMLQQVKYFKGLFP